MPTYRTIKTISTGAYREKGSQFLAYAYPVNDGAEINSLIKQLWKDHPKARHVCYAYRIGVKGNKIKIDDNGEPANTAGGPIMNHLTGKSLTFILVAVVRYFGGTKLGKGGLVNAYGTAAKNALDQAEVVEEQLTKALMVSLPFEGMNAFMGLMKKYQLSYGEQEFDNNCRFTVYLPEDETEVWKERLLSIKGLKIIG